MRLYCTECVHLIPRHHKSTSVSILPKGAHPSKNRVVVAMMCSLTPKLLTKVSVVSAVVDLFPSSPGSSQVRGLHREDATLAEDQRPVDTDPAAGDSCMCIPLHYGIYQ